MARNLDMAVADTELLYNCNAYLEKRDQYFVCVQDGRLQVPLDRGLTRGDEWIFHYYEYMAFHPHRGDVTLGVFRHKELCIHADSDSTVALKNAPENFEDPLDSSLFIVNEWDPCYLESARYEGHYLHFDKTHGQLDLARRHTRVERTQSYDFNIQFTLSTRGTKLKHRNELNGWNCAGKPTKSLADSKRRQGRSSRAREERQLTKIQQMGRPEPCLISVLLPAQM